ncbi:pentapeptide repeat-containing protein [Streptomyces althioticus]|uniref:pentapeptide repeat-containing protein n=1 Tax=Streptomyces althioticus TaxID=83380 RepID=UPI0038731222|nr:pentapeptide repeat-containing protein [Streptomyces althioticus]
MITLHLLREQGGASVRAAVSAFEARHTHGGAEPDREQAEQHFVLLSAVIAGAWPRPATASRAAEREAVHVLLAVGDLPGHRCPVCVRPQAPLPQPTAGAGSDMTDDEHAEHEARLRGLLYLSCPDAPAGALEATAEAITRSAGRVPAAAVPEAADLARPRQPYSADPLNLCGADLRDAALMGADLRHADAYGADLSGADLTGADLSHANLTGVDLSHAHLTGANLTDANLSNAQLSHANMNGAVLRDAALTDTDLRSALLCGVDLTGADLMYADMTDAHLRGAVLTGADLSEAVLTGADVSEAVLMGADLSGAVLTGSALEDATIPCPDHR